MKLALSIILILLFSLNWSFPAERSARFDEDPQWHSHNNRVGSPEGRPVRQDFGYSRTAHCQSGVGEIGGFIQPVAEPAYYATSLPSLTLADSLHATGKLVCQGRQLNLLIGFFNAHSLNEWRTPNTIALRIYGRGDVFYAYAEYATSKWRAGATEFPAPHSQGASRPAPYEFSSGTAVHQWSLRYDPNAADGNGAIFASINDQNLVVNLEPGHKLDAAYFNRFGLFNIMKHYDTGGELWLDDIELNGQKLSFDSDPQWTSLNNRRSFITRDVRPWFDFGFSNTHFAGGQRAGELGGLIFRGDGRSPDKMAFYGDRLQPLYLNQPLKARGKVSFQRGVSDSDTLIGFFHSKHSLESGGTDAQATPPDFLGIRIGGPSREGFFFAPLFRLHGPRASAAPAGPYIYPDGTARDWSLDYDPAGAQGKGRITVRLSGSSTYLDLAPDDKTTGAHFDRFGIITTHHDGNGQIVYFDDLTYTGSQD